MEDKRRASTFLAKKNLFFSFSQINLVGLIDVVDGGGRFPEVIYSCVSPSLGLSVCGDRRLIQIIPSGWSGFDTALRNSSKSICPLRSRSLAMNILFKWFLSAIQRCLVR